MIVGLTGLYCAGKNHIAVMLEKWGLPVLDADTLGHEVIERERESIVRRFGKDVLNSNGTIDRKRLGKIVFGKPEEIAALEAIVHPAVVSRIEEWAASHKETPLAVINAALLHKLPCYGRLPTVLVVKAPFLLRLFRSAKRDKRPLFELLKRMQSQKDFPRYNFLPYNFFRRKNKKQRTQLFFTSADIYIIQNSGFLASGRKLEKRIETILEGLRYGKEKITADCSFGGRNSRHSV